MEIGDLDMPVLKYFGHAAFKFYSPKVSVIFDPGIVSNKALMPESEKTNIICVSHEHRDHLGNAAQLSTKQKAFLLGNEQTIKVALKEGAPEWLVRKIQSGETFERPNIKVTALELRHGPSTEPINTPNLCFIVEIDKVRVAHLGDAMTKGLLEQYPIDVLLIGVDGTEAFNSNQSLNAIADIKPQLAIPMHIRTEHEIDYFFTHAQTVAPKTNFRKMKPGDEIRVEWLAGTEFSIS
jgi:L-ascorbate metabolism protein UlaG (beta-lactamase superfamily)